MFSCQSFIACYTLIFNYQSVYILWKTGYYSLSYFPNHSDCPLTWEHVPFFHNHRMINLHQWTLFHSYSYIHTPHSYIPTYNTTISFSLSYTLRYNVIPYFPSSSKFIAVVWRLWHWGLMPSAKVEVLRSLPWLQILISCLLFFLYLSHFKDNRLSS